MRLLVPRAYAYEMESTARLFFPGEKIQVEDSDDDGGGDTIALLARPAADGAVELCARARLGDWTCGKTGLLPPGSGDDETEWALARLLYQLLCDYSGARPPWGILTGVRPARLCRSMAAAGMDSGQVRRTLRERYLADQGKIDLIQRVVEAQEGLLAKARPDGFSLYISIPFCPSRCLYCSFVSHDIQGVAKLVPQYVELLVREIAHTGQLAARRGLRLQTIYFGGGTPTTLDPGQLRAIMEAVSDSFDLSGLLEYTVEAGRPDTLTAEKLAVLREMGADRISVNPQTMDDGILRQIGRRHTAQAVVEGVALAREAGFGAVNMDLIAGLPGETGAAFSDTVDQVLALRPENITVHTLTVKRSSRLREREDAYDSGALDVSALLDTGRERLTAAGYGPYYLYRQKGTVGNLENTGYALPGREGLYNVLIMEEVQTILAVGAGAVTKVCLPDAVKRVFNFKFPYEYISRFGEVLERKSEAERLLAAR